MTTNQKRRGRPLGDQITDAQRRTLKEVRDFVAIRKFPPTMMELGSLLGVTAASAHQLVKQLERKGYVTGHRHSRRLPSDNRRDRSSRRSTRHVRHRSLFLESLEDRRLMNVDWRYPVDSLDVDGSGSIVPKDAILVINELNANGSHALPDQRPEGSPYLDTSGNQLLAPLDALLVINHLNATGSGARQLSEGSKLADEHTVVITVGQNAGSRKFQARIAANFDTSATDAAVEDTLAVYLVDPDHVDQTLLDRGTPGTALFTLSGRKVEMAAGLVSWDGSILTIDTSSLAARDTAVLRFQMLSSDGDSGTKITVSPLTNVVDPEGTPGTPVARAESPWTAGPATNVAGLSSQPDVEVKLENIRFTPGTGRYAADLRLHNAGAAIGRNAVVAFPGLPAGVTLRNPSGTNNGVPYLNLAPSIATGGLGTEDWSQPLLVEFDDPSQTRFTIDTDVLGGTNHAPTLAAIAPLTTSPGGIARVTLSGADQDGDALSYSLRGAPNLPTGGLTQDATLMFRSKPGQLGSYQFEVVVSDGILEASQPVTLNVIADIVNTTRVSGRVLQLDGSPLANMPLEIGTIQGLTDATGSFQLDLGAGPVVSDTLKVRGELFPGPVVYPFIGEKLFYVLQHELYLGANNVIDRPIYLPALDVANGKTIDPMQDTTVTTAAIPGASAFVKAGTLMNQQGTPFTGKVSITEVPTQLTPAALPPNLIPDLVVTVQPGEMVFATPAPMTLPNRAGWAPGTVMNLWSINPSTGVFEDVGDMVVSADGQTIVTTSGGIRNSSWHFAAPPIDQPDPGPNPNEPKRDCPREENKCPINSEVETYSGAVIETHDLVTYQSQGQMRGLQLVYDSLRADPRPIVHFRYNTVAPDPYKRLAAGAAISRGEFVKGLSYFYNDGVFASADNYWSIPASGGTVDAALQLDMSSEPTGTYDYSLSTGILIRSASPVPGALSIPTGSTANRVGKIVHVNSIASPFGAGWGLAGLQQLFKNPDGSIQLVDGDGSELVFGPGLVSPPGEFSTLTVQLDGSYLRTFPNQTVYAFDSTGRMTSIRDRNNNLTTYVYDASGNLESITDPVGLKTTFAYQNGRVSSITDPANRVTTFEYVAGNLTKVTDPDNASRQWKYDSNHHQVEEIDQRGFHEVTHYDFAGRATRAVHKDDTETTIRPNEVRGLYRNTSDPDHSPVAVSIGGAKSEYVQPNGNVITTNLDAQGQATSSRDLIGPLPKTDRNDQNLVTMTTDARGNITRYSYDARGNLLSVVDSLSGTGVISGEIQQMGEHHIYIMQRKAGDRLIIDGLDPPGIDGGARIEIFSPDHTFVEIAGSGSDLAPIIFPKDGEYRIRVKYTLSNFSTGSVVPYQFRLRDVVAAETLPSDKQITVKIPAYEMALKQFDATVGQHVRVFSSMPDSRVRVYEPSSRQWVTRDGFDWFNGFVAPVTGKYLVTLANDDSTPIDATLRLEITDQGDAPRLGFNELHTGTIPSGETRQFDLSGPAGLPIAFETVGVNQGSRKVTSGGIEIQTSDQVATLRRSGEFSVAVTAYSNFPPANYGFRVLDMTSPDRQLTTGVPKSVTLEPGAMTFFAFDGVLNQRVVLAAPGLDVYTFGVQVADGFAGAFMPATAKYYVRVSNPGQDPVSTTLTKFDVAVETLTLGAEVTGTLTPHGAPRLFKFEGEAGDRMYFDALGGAGGGRFAILKPDGKNVAPLGAFYFQNSLQADTAGPLYEDGTFYLLLSADDSAVPVSYDFRLLKGRTLSQPLTFGQEVSGVIELPRDVQEYTFQGTAGQRLYYDGLREQYSGLKYTLLSPAGVYLNDRSWQYSPSVDSDFPGTTLEETGLYRLQVFGDYEIFYHWNEPFHFRVLDVPSLPSLNIGGTTNGVLEPGRFASAYQFVGHRGQQLHIVAKDNQGAPSTIGFSITGPDNKTVGVINSNSADFFLTQNGTYIVTDQGTPTQNPLPFSLVVDDLSESPVTPSGLGTLLTGHIDAGETDTHSFDAPAGLTIYFDNHNAEDVGLDVVITAPGNSWSTSFNLGRNDFGPVVLPHSGTFTVRVQGENAQVAGDYEFRIGDVIHDAVPIALGQEVQGSFDANKRGTHLYQFTTTPGQAFLFDRFNPGWTQVIQSPDVVHTGFQPRIGLAGTHFIYVTPDAAQGVPYGFRVLDLESVPDFPIGEIVEGVAEPGRAVIYKMQSQPGDRFVYQLFNSQIAYTFNRAMQFNSRSDYQFTEFNAPFGGTMWLLRDLDGIQTPLAYKLKVDKPATTETTLRASGGSAGELMYTYDSTFSQMTSQTDSLGRQTLMNVDPVNGNRLSSTQVVGEVGGPDDLVTTFTYMPSGQVDTMTDPLGRITDYDYDSKGRVTSITMAKGTQVETVQRFEYDTAGRTVATIDGNNHRRDFEYDPRNRVTKITGPDPDGAGPLTSPVTQFTYDEAGNRATIKDAAGHVSRWTYDPLGRVVTQVDPGLNATSFEYDRNGNVLKITDPLSHVTNFEYDLRDRVVGTVDAEGKRTTSKYDFDNNLVSVTDASKNKTMFQLDARNRVTKRTDPLGRSASYEYDSTNALTKRTDAIGRITELSYDEVGRLEKETWRSGSQVVNTIEYTYDRAGNAIHEQDAFSDLQFTVDALDRIVQERDAGPGYPVSALTSTYDRDGNRLSFEDKIGGVEGPTNSYNYDALNRTTSIVQAGPGVAPKRVNLQYNGLGQLTELTRFADAAGQIAAGASTYSYDELNRLQSIVHRNAASQVLGSFTYEFDAASRIKKIIDVDGTTDYAYDRRDELTAAAHSDLANPDESYSYDATGNRISSHLHGNGYVVGDDIAATPDANRLTSDGKYNYVYDDVGNLARRIEIASGKVREYVYDHRNRLIQVTDRPAAGGAASQVVVMTYDLLNRRTSIKVDAAPGDAEDGVVTYFVYDHQDVLAEWTDADGSGPGAPTETMRYLYGPNVDQVLAQENGAGEVLWELTDHLGTVHDLADSQGQVANHLKYDSFGATISQSHPEKSTRYRFTGREFDGSLDLQYSRARYYDAAIGRFISEDPISLRGRDVNLYRYVENDVTRLVDPNGTSFESQAADALAAAMQQAIELQKAEQMLAAMQLHNPTTGLALLQKNEMWMKAMAQINKSGIGNIVRVHPVVSLVMLLPDAIPAFSKLGAMAAIAAGQADWQQYYEMFPEENPTSDCPPKGVS